jgi:hypothetical protein
MPAIFVISLLLYIYIYIYKHYISEVLQPLNPILIVTAVLLDRWQHLS